MSVQETTRALIVEDDPVVARSVARRLLREGYTVSLAQSCRAARAAGAGFFIATLDLDLPDGNGAELASELLRLGSVQRVVFYTGSLDPVQRDRAATLGPVVDKTRDVAELVGALGPPSSAPASSVAPTQGRRARHPNARSSRSRVEEAPIDRNVAEIRSSRR